MATTMEIIKDIRERTGLSLKDIKKAVESYSATHSEINLEAVIEDLRKTGVLKAQAKEGRVTSEGRVATYNHNGTREAISFLTKSLAVFSIAALFVGTIQNPILSFAENIARATYQPTTEQKLNDLIILEKFVDEDSVKNTINSEREFDEEEALKNTKISKESILLKEEMVAYNQQIIDNSQDSFYNGQDNVKVSKFPKVEKLFEELETMDPNYAPNTEKTSAINFTDIKTSANIYKNLKLAKQELLSRASCGYYNNPRPKTSAPKPSSWHHDPEKTLTDWGYHRTAKYATGREYGIYDYTRNITYNSRYCKNNSFRDHAGIDGDGRGGKSNILREQKYWGYTPNGECNPEIHSYTWPYPEWPAYCKWWHDRN